MECGNWILSLHCSTDTAEAVSTYAQVMKQRGICNIRYEQVLRISLLLLQLRYLGPSTKNVELKGFNNTLPQALEQICEWI